MSQHSIIVENLRKSYKSTLALDGVSFSVTKGEIFGFLGPDGSGKTTLFRILATLLLADAGKVTLEGMDVVKDYKKIRNILGYMPGRFSLYQDLSVEQNLAFFATIFGTTIQENYHLIRDIYVQLEPFKDRRAGKLSGGMKQKLALCCSLIHKPHILILDEPTTGVDAVSRSEFWEMLQKLKQEDITILVSTAYMDEAALCDEVALVQGGRFLAIDRPAGISSRFLHSLFAVKSEDMYRLIQDLRSFPETMSAYMFGQVVHLTLPDPSATRDLQLFLEQKGHRNIEIEAVKPGIEDCFIQLMSQEKIA